MNATYVTIKMIRLFFFFFFQAEDGIRDVAVTGVQTCALPISGDLQIMKLAANGAKVKKGDVLVEFDNTTVKQKLAQDQSALKSADAEIQQSRAAARLKEEKDLTDVMTADYDVRKTRMDASKQEILSVIEGEQAKLKVADAEEKLKEAEAKLKEIGRAHV